ncbi:MAG: 50S ribosomal protein L15 [Elusimicrobia bacterium RIFOXYC2_FULL_34_12]|nr:MAG: 50S ribosomal protein L15 [Elusimicrobia bacterium RIFOXYC2_FULL_34_12]HAM38840.1 50S ribosomal protein L15 [Elusimicrobiota bacterium]
MKISDLKPASGSKHRRKIVGRGRGSGHGGSATKGMKGQNSRSGGGTRPGFEGGQMPLMRRIPKRGFTNIFKKEYEIVNLKTIEERFESNSEVNRASLIEKGLIKNNLPIKILGDGNINKPLKITASKFSKSAIEKIKKVGGEAIIVKNSAVAG